MQTEKLIDSSILTLVTSYIKLICREPSQTNPQ